MDSPLLDNSVHSPPSVGHHEEEKPLKIVHKIGVESKKLWKIAGPTILTALSQFSLGALTSTFVGHVNELDLAAFSIENSVIAGFAYGFLVCKLFTSPFY
jgi:multidrug resistance protein, MATE family